VVLIAGLSPWGLKQVVGSLGSSDMDPGLDKVRKQLPFTICKEEQPKIQTRGSNTTLQTESANHLAQGEGFGTGGELDGTPTRAPFLSSPQIPT